MELTQEEISILSNGLICLIDNAYKAEKLTCETSRLRKNEVYVMEQLLKYVEELNTNTPDGQIVDADTILKDIMDEQDFEISGMAQDIFNIYHKSSDKQAVKEMFFEFTGMEFDQYLMKCSREITRK